MRGDVEVLASKTEAPEPEAGSDYRSASIEVSVRSLEHVRASGPFNCSFICSDLPPSHLSPRASNPVQTANKQKNQIKRGGELKLICSFMSGEYPELKF